MRIHIGQTADHGFDEPFGLLTDCHRRITNFVQLLIDVTQEARGGPLSVNQREALAGALSYFQTAGPLHTADEEDSLFPRLRAAVAPEVRQALLLVELLERDHHRADGHHARVEVLCHRWMAANALSPHDLIDLTAHLTELHTLYRAHIDVEDHDLFPLAARVLTPATVQAIGREMAARRRVRTSPVAE